MATLRISASGVVLHPELPIGRERVIVARDQEMLSGTLRRAYRAEKLRFTYTRGNLSEAERVTWINAHPRNASFTLIDELGGSYTVLLETLTEDLERTVPVTPGASAGSGTSFYRVSVSVRQV